MLSRSLRAGRRWILFGIVAVLGAVGAWSLARPSATAPLPFLILDFDEYQNGDLIFRRGIGNLSRIVLSTDPDSLYSHVGLVWLDGDDVLVIHASPGESFGRPTPVQVDRLERFLEPRDAQAAAVLRLTTETARAGLALRAMTAAREFVEQGTVFDADLDLKDSSALYCTELVWKAYRKAGLDLAEDRLYRSSFLGETPILLPGGLLESPHLKLVHRYRTQKGNS